MRKWRKCGKTKEAWESTWRLFKETSRTYLSKYSYSIVWIWRVGWMYRQSNSPCILQDFVPLRMLVPCLLYSYHQAGHGYRWSSLTVWVTGSWWDCVHQTYRRVDRCIDGGIDNHIGSSENSLSSFMPYCTLFLPLLIPYPTTEYDLPDPVCP